MREGFNLKNLFFSHDEKDLAEYSFIGEEISLSIFNIFISLIGLVGNGNVIWLLGFHIKRKPLATYILNLAVADFGSLLFLLLLNILMNLPYINKYFLPPPIVYQILLSLSQLMYSSSQFLLTAISIDRCVSVLFPNRYQHHRSPVLSTSVCVLMWALTFVLSSGPLILEFAGLAYYNDPVIDWVYLVSTSICISLMTISALILLIKVCFRSHRCQCGNLLKVILLMLLSFILLTFVTCAYAYARLITNQFTPMSYFILGITLRSDINPLIYFLVGRQNGGKFQERMKVILQRVFKEDRDTGAELQPRIETPL
ncbi:proto-oncogene Mas-like [Eublepharis macularius]|uniref:Proto-oncogene Mas-like n=1 Tax=Eublepharis macularius TaxID=481883 RepID=A0AA97JRR5_EUBMA|nr:proto-oncogene Mas-like [Eublepharis macularius]